MDCNEWQGYDIRSDSFREAKPDALKQIHQKKKKNEPQKTPTPKKHNQKTKTQNTATLRNAN